MLALSVIALGVIACLAWIYLAALNHGFWKCDQRLPDIIPEPDIWPDVTAVVPARDEAASIGACVAALCAQEYPGNFRVIVVDDASTDGTADIVRALDDDRVTVMAAPPLVPGWTGKLSALNAGVAASGTSPFLWFTDADIVHGPYVLQHLVAHALDRRRDLTSLMVRLRCESFWEKLVVPAFIYFFQMLYPFRAVNDDRSRVAAAAGGCVLIRRDALIRAGGLAAIKNAVIDDCALAAVVKRSGGTLWLGLTETSHSLRAAETLAPLWRMVARTAFVQLRHSILLLAGTVLGLAILFAVPPLALLAGFAGYPPLVLLGGAALTLMVVTYGPTVRAYGLPIIAAFTLPAAGILYGAMTVGSAVAHLQGRGAAWKGRHYDPSATPPNLPKSL